MLQTAVRLACLAALMAVAACNHIDLAEQPPARSSLGPYALRANDQIRIQVYNEPTITGDYTVDGAGFVSVPLAGQVKASGLTTTQLERALTAKLNNGMLKDARVNVQVANYSPFYIRGEVKKAGEFPYRPGMTVSDAVALAGGYTYRADESKVYVRSARAAGEIMRLLETDIPVSPGDNIRIPERLF
jgi:polysaccharide export outer membrane protein